MTTKYIVIKPGKYNGKYLERGDEFIPEGGKWDHVIIDPEKKYIRIEEVPDVPKKPAPKKRKAKPP